MLRWLHLATRNWRVRPGRAIAVVLSVALGVATVVMVTGFYETAQRMITDEVVANWVGTAHLSVEPSQSTPCSIAARMSASFAVARQAQVSAAP